MATASKKLAAQQRLSNAPKSDKAVADEVKTAQAAQKAPVKTSAPNVQTLPKEKAEITPETKVRGPSIRGLIQTRLAEGKTTEEISEELQVAFPGTKAAEKARKHISFYRSRMKKEGKALPVPAGSEPQKVVVSAKKGAAKKVVQSGTDTTEAEA